MSTSKKTGNGLSIGTVFTSILAPVLVGVLVWWLTNVAFQNADVKILSIIANDGYGRTADFSSDFKFSARYTGRIKNHGNAPAQQCRLWIGSSGVSDVFGLAPQEETAITVTANFDSRFLEPAEREDKFMRSFVTDAQVRCLNTTSQIIPGSFSVMNRPPLMIPK